MLYELYYCSSIYFIIFSVNLFYFLAYSASGCRVAYILPLWFFLFRRLISEVTEWISTKLGHIFTYDCYLKNLVRTPLGIYPHGLGQKTLFGTDFEL